MSTDFAYFSSQAGPEKLNPDIDREAAIDAKKPLDEPVRSSYEANIRGQQRSHGNAISSSGTMEGSKPNAEVSPGEDNDKARKADVTNKGPGPSRVAYRYEYFSLSNNEQVFTDDNYDPGKEPDRTLPVFEVITMAYTREDRDTRLPNEAAKHRAPAVVVKGPIVLVVKSRAVINALRTVIGYYPGESFSGDSIRIQEPFPMIVHYRQELEQYRDQFRPEIPKPDGCEAFPDTFEDLGFVLDFVQEKVGKAIQDERERHLREDPLLTFDMLWMLFKPGSDVYCDVSEDGEYSAFVVKDLSWMVLGGSAKTYTINLWNIDCNSTYVGASTPHEVSIPPFGGEKRISRLQVFPCEYLNAKDHKQNHEERRTYLENRGSMFFDLLRKKQYVKFDGLSMTWPRRKYSGMAMVDMVQYCQNDENELAFEDPALADDIEECITLVPPCSCSRCDPLIQKSSAEKSKFAGYSRINPLMHSGLTPHQRFLCCHRMRAFMFKLRQWKELHIDGFSFPKFQPGLINTLVIPEATRSLLTRLCRRYTDAEQEEGNLWSADFVKGKGEGMIFLLHGRPGVGKTYTAECVAEEMKRPLLSLTCADIGTDPAKVDQKLEFWFKLAKNWGAILVLDEADVYMEQRSISDMPRNNLVAGFLRKLEYYQGILFLTTNRVGTFDEAFLSRIDVPIYYPEFNEAQRVGIWNTFFSKLEREREKDIRVSRPARTFVREDDTLLSLKWNAREIRNAFQTAVALAEIERQKDAEGLIVVTDDHVKTVVDMSKNFKDYLKTLYQKNEAERAAARGIRWDLYGTESEKQSAAAPV